MINQPSIAILIDCWDKPEIPSITNFHSQILQFIDKTDAIKTIVLASYNCQKERMNSDSIWYQNYNQIFNMNNNRNIKDLKYVHRVFEKYNTSFPNENTSTAILNYRNPNKFQIAMQWGWELQYYLELNPDIKNIYVLGSAWDLCVKIRPLGYEALQTLADINILTESSCIRAMKDNSLVIEDCWVNIQDNVYHLQR